MRACQACMLIKRWIWLSVPSPSLLCFGNHESLPYVSRNPWCMFSLNLFALCWRTEEIKWAWSVQRLSVCVH
jgi:hypothetical protein